MRNPLREDELQPVTAVTRYADEVDFIDLCRIAWSYKLLVFCAVIVGGGIATAFAFTEIPVYRAEAVVVQVRSHDMSGSQSMMDQLGSIASLAGVNLPISDSSTEEARAILQSRSLSRSFIERYDLLAQLLPDKSGKGPSPTIARAVDRFQSDVLSIRDDARKGTTTVTIDWTSPDGAASWANNYIALANEIVRARAMDDSSKDVAYLQKQLSKTTDVELQRVMYGLVESETKTLMLANSRPDYAFRVVDPAEPPDRRLRPRRVILLLVGIAAGLALGLLTAFTLNRVRNSRRS